MKKKGFDIIIDRNKDIKWKFKIKKEHERKRRKSHLVNKITSMK